MNAQHPWKALLWKEWREIRSFAWLLVILPPVVNLVDNGRFHPEGLVRVAGNVMFFVVIAMWAAAKGGAERSPDEFTSSHLPANPTVTWTVSFCLPLVGAVAAGAWCGLWSAVPERAVFGAFGGAATLALAYLLASAFGTQAGIFVGALSAFTVGFALAMSREFDVPGGLDPAWLPFLGLGISAVIGSVVLGLAARRWNSRARQGATIALLACGAALGMWNSTPWSGVYSAGQSTRGYPVPRLDSADWSLYVSPRMPSGQKFEMEFGDLRAGRTLKREFEVDTVPVDFLGRDRVILLQQTRRDWPLVRVLQWDTKSDRLAELMSFRVGPGALYPVRGFVRPDGRYMLLVLRSMAGQGRDLWVINLARQTAMVAYANAKLPSGEVRWSADTATLDGNGQTNWVGAPALLVRLSEARASVLRAPEKAGG